jgi:hypothetical protein
MRQDDRRKELGKMLMDVAKYLATVGLVGSFLTDNLTYPAGLIITIVTLVLLTVAFYIIPPNKGD